MELKRPPRTKLKHWALIEDLGGFVFRESHLLGYGFPDPDGSLNLAVQEAQKMLVQLVQEACIKFGLTFPPNCPPPPGYQPPPRRKLQYYWDWYQEMKEKALVITYPRLICSICPYSNGSAGFGGGGYSCRHIAGYLKIIALDECGMVNLRGFHPDQGWSGAQFEEAVRKKGGEPLLQRMRKHQQRTRRWCRAHGVK